MSNYLRGSKCYLSGAIEHQRTANWRDEPKKYLHDEFGIIVFDPHSDPKQNFVPDLTKARAEKDYGTMRRIAKGFVRKDLATLDRADYIIGYLPYQLPTTGTHHEIINSNNSKKPTLLVSEAKELIPVWYYGFINPDFMFGGWNDLYAYLKEVDNGLHKDNDRWAFIYGLV